MTTEQSAAYSPAIHRLAVVLTIAVFPLIWVGGLVTTYDAGMAVPDWPGTYGWNMFAYPVSTWLFGPFDLLVEHSHRLLGALAGFLSIGLLVAAVRFDGRLWFRWWCGGVLLGVILQGALGGARVVLDQRTFAMIHGCTGPLFFAIATATAVMSSRWWLQAHFESGTAQAVRRKSQNAPKNRAARAAPLSTATESRREHDAGPQLPSEPSQSKANSTHRLAVWVATALVCASYLQLIMGAQLRHVTGAVSHRVFMVFVHMHLTLAAVVLILALLLALQVGLSRSAPKQVRRPAELLSLLVLLQIALGIGTWIVNYALPWAELNSALATYTILAKGYWESFIVTAHMATGSLIISLSTVVTLRAWRSRAAMTNTSASVNKVGMKWKHKTA